VNVGTFRANRSLARGAFAVAIVLAAGTSIVTPSFAAATLRDRAAIHSLQGRSVAPGYGRAPAATDSAPDYPPGVSADPAPDNLQDPGGCMFDDDQGRFLPCDGAGGA
jgi:hypothetical protein